MNVRPDVAMWLDRFGPGGVERVAIHIANGLQRRGCRVEMIVLEDAGPVRSLLDQNVVVRRVGGRPGLRRRARMKAAVPAVSRYLRSHSPGLFHSPGNHTNRHAALAVALSRYRRPFVPKITNPLLDGRMGAPRRFLRLSHYRWALRRAARILLLSPSAVDWIRQVDPGLVSRTCSVHNPYVSADMLAAAAARAPSQPPLILSIGRLSEQKNHAMLLRAAARLRDRPWRLRICGSGPEESALRSLAVELNIADRVELPGFVADAIPHYLAATVTALSSRWEGLPAVLLEAMACGCPVVATASSPGMVQLMDEVGAREPVKVGDEAEFAEALRTALDGQLPKVPPNATLPYSIEAACDEHASIFAELLDR